MRLKNLATSGTGEMGDEERIIIAELKTRLDRLEDDVKEIKNEQTESRKRSELAALRERDISATISLLNDNLTDHIRLHEETSKKRIDATTLIMLAISTITGILAAIAAFEK